MEAKAPILAYCNPRRGSVCSSSLPSLTFFHSQNSIFASPYITCLCFKSYSGRKLPQLKASLLSSLRPVKASAAEIPSSNSSERWLFEPIGNGDTRHIGFRVPLPKAFEIASNVVTVGRLPEKADVVIPVATVSGLHARIEKKEEALVVTDLDSTNGTFVDDKKLTPGASATVSPGSCITFGDTNLAIFRVSKLEVYDLSSKPDESEMKLD
ncbi:SMAD/FHA domain-containing protein [Tasmannia lanceolata]|uniref:SMAD/FHA domain-containing protein n=1 Tax=Tasmannia lanceolata TaxID=3420 RepID=UPI00406489BE